MNSARKRIVVCGIGTGGHYFPAVVVARELQNRRYPVLFLVRTGFSEEKAARRYGIDTFAVKARPFFGRSIATKANFLLSLAYSLYRLLPLTRKGIGFACGGFGSLPLILSCIINRRPYYLLEPNSIPGRATRLMSFRARRVFLGIPVRTALEGRSMYTGVPIRSEFRNTGRGLPASGPARSILVMGGSQGAARVNELALELSVILPEGCRLTIISGPRDYEWVKSRSNDRTRVIPFTNEPWTEIGAADIIVSRSGALAGYEILAMGKRALFIPFPFAIDNHQYYNALFFAREGGGAVVEEKGLTARLLLDRINELAQRRADHGPRVIMDAEKTIADEIERGDP